MTGHHVSACRCIWCSSVPVSDDDLYLDAIFESEIARNTIKNAIENHTNRDDTMLQLIGKDHIQRLNSVASLAKNKEGDPVKLIEIIDEIREDFVNLLLNVKLIKIIDEIR